MGRTMDFMNSLVTGWYAEPGAIRPSAAPSSARTRRVTRVRAGERPLPHPRADQSANRPLAHLCGPGRAVPAPGQGVGDAGGYRRARRQDAWAPWRQSPKRYCATRSARGSPRATNLYAVSFFNTHRPSRAQASAASRSPRGPHNRFDHPLSSRFEEMDCIAVFDDVLVPWDRVVIDGGPGSGRSPNEVGVHGGCRRTPNGGAHVEPDGVFLRPGDEAGRRDRRYRLPAHSREAGRDAQHAGGRPAPCSRIRSDGDRGAGRHLGHRHAGAAGLPPQDDAGPTAALSKSCTSSAAAVSSTRRRRPTFDNPEERVFIDKYTRGRARRLGGGAGASVQAGVGRHGQRLRAAHDAVVSLYSGDPIRLTAVILRWATTRSRCTISLTARWARRRTSTYRSRPTTSADHAAALTAGTGHDRGAVPGGVPAEAAASGLDLRRATGRRRVRTPARKQPRPATCHRCGW